MDSGIGPLELVRRSQDQIPSSQKIKLSKQLFLMFVWQVPLFHNLDDLILDNICDRVKPLVFSKDEKVLMISSYEQLKHSI